MRRRARPDRNHHTPTDPSHERAVRCETNARFPSSAPDSGRLQAADEHGLRYELCGANDVLPQQTLVEVTALGPQNTNVVGNIKVMHASSHDDDRCMAGVHSAKRTRLDPTVDDVREHAIDFAATARVVDAVVLDIF